MATKMCLQTSAIRNPGTSPTRRKKAPAKRLNGPGTDHFAPKSSRIAVSLSVACASAMDAATSLDPVPVSGDLRQRHASANSNGGPRASPAPSFSGKDADRGSARQERGHRHRRITRDPIEMESQT